MAEQAAMDKKQCSGHITFNAIYPSAFSEWPHNLPGKICKTPPFGPESASRLAECCSGPVYNITSPTTPDHPAYPVSCALLCQIDPNLDLIKADTPYGWDDLFMCVMDGTWDTSDGGSVTCDTVSVEGVPQPSSFSSTPTGPWTTDWTSYWTEVTINGDGQGDPYTHWIASSDLQWYGLGSSSTATTTAEEETSSPSSSLSVSETASSSDVVSSSSSSSSTSAEGSVSTTTSSASSSVDTEEVAAPTGTSGGLKFGWSGAVAVLLVVSVACGL